MFVETLVEGRMYMLCSDRIIETVKRIDLPCFMHLMMVSDMVMVSDVHG